MSSGTGRKIGAEKVKLPAKRTAEKPVDRALRTRKTEISRSGQSHAKDRNSGARKTKIGIRTREEGQTRTSSFLLILSVIEIHVMVLLSIGDTADGWLKAGQPLNSGAC